jgi:DNA-binding MarR family transcriptional regulator
MVSPHLPLQVLLWGFFCYLEDNTQLSAQEVVVVVSDLSLSSLMIALNSLGERYAKRPSLTELVLLTIIAENPGITQTDIRERFNTGLTRQSMATYIGRLRDDYDDPLVTDLEDPAGGRKKFMAVTKAGKGMYEELLGALKGA